MLGTGRRGAFRVALAAVGSATALLMVGPSLEHVQAVDRAQVGATAVPTAQPPAAGVAAWTVPVTRDFTLLGLPRLTLDYRAVTPDIELNSRLWDVAPDGSRTLITRGAYRAVAPKPGGDVADYELFGNAWRLRAGHSLTLEVTQDDATYLRADNFASTATIDSARLVLPGRS